jgi:hypothetical protein
VRKW